MSAPAAPVPACIGQPLSWLVLERHALAELEGAAAAAARTHLAACAACAAALDHLRADRPVLPALPAPAHAAPPAPASPIPVRPERSRDVAASPAPSLAARRRRRAGLTAGLAAAAAAAALLLAVLVRGPDRGPGALVASVRVKGAGLVDLTLVRERAGAIAFDPPDVGDADRWKVQLTCAPGGGAQVEVVVYQPGAPPAIALPARPFACGNAVVLAGAFRITGGAATVCARLAPTATGLAIVPPARPGPSMACRRLAAAP
ncbi:MAG: hypothetical protein KJZ91_05725 [Myxococcales bacterium]|nr:hypothetical protein [Myxococcales bacterium]